MLRKTFTILLLVLLLSSMHVMAAESEKYGGSFVFPLPYGGGVDTLDPIMTTRTQSLIPMKSIYAQLLKIDPENLEIAPDIAKSWDISEDGKIYTFHLRKGVKFHNGQEVTAEDVKYSYERITDPKTASSVSHFFLNVVGAEDFKSGKTEHISGIEVIDPYTVKITLTSIDVNFLYNVARIEAAIVPENIVKESANNFANNPVGAGPFKFVKWIRGSEIVVEAFEDYYNGRPYLDKVQYRVMTESSSRMVEFQSEGIDFDIVAPSQYKRYKNDPVYKDNLIEVAELWTRNIHFNLDIPELQDVRVRKAFNYAANEKLIVEKLLAGKAYPATGWLPPSSSAYNPDLVGYNYNPKKAKELMEEAGYTSDNPLNLEVIGTDNPAWGIRIVEAIMPDLKEIGFKLKPVLVDGATLADKLTTGNYEIGIYSWGGYVSPVTYLSQYFWSKVDRASGNYTNYYNPEFDKYIEKAMKTIDKEQRVKLLQKAEEELVADPPVWFYNYNKAVAVHQPWVHGIVPSAEEMTYIPMEKVWVDGTSPRK